MPRDSREDLGDMKLYIKTLLKKQGRDFTKCEFCSKTIKDVKRIVIHHTKYIGATLYDIKIICQSCNTLDENKNLL